jgi:dihydroxyacid dehydratase/phosphogluconate dehydratase
MLTFSIPVGDLAFLIKKSVEKEGFLGWRYNTAGISDAITMGNEGMYKLKISATVESLS